MIERREFLVGCSAAALAVAAPGTVLAAVGGLGERLGGEPPRTRQVFRGQVNTRFELLGPGGRRVPLELVAVEDGPRSPGLDQFFLVFRGDGAAPGAGSYTVRHDRLGRLAMYLEPAGASGGSFRLEAAHCVVG